MPGGDGIPQLPQRDSFPAQLFEQLEPRLARRALEVVEEPLRRVIDVHLARHGSILIALELLLPRMREKKPRRSGSGAGAGAAAAGVAAAAQGSGRRVAGDGLDAAEIEVALGEADDGDAAGLDPR